MSYTRTMSSPTQRTASPLVLSGSETEDDEIYIAAIRNSTFHSAPKRSSPGLDRPDHAPGSAFEQLVAVAVSGPMLSSSSAPDPRSSAVAPQATQPERAQSPSSDPVRYAESLLEQVGQLPADTVCTMGRDALRLLQPLNQPELKAQVYLAVGDSLRTKNEKADQYRQALQILDQDVPSNLRARLHHRLGTCLPLHEKAAEFEKGLRALPVSGADHELRKLLMHNFNEASYRDRHGESKDQARHRRRLERYRSSAPYSAAPYSAIRAATNNTQPSVAPPALPPQSMTRQIARTPMPLSSSTGAFLSGRSHPAVPPPPVFPPYYQPQQQRHQHPAQISVPLQRQPMPYPQQQQTQSSLSRTAPMPAAPLRQDFGAATARNSSTMAGGPAPAFLPGPQDHLVSAAAARLQLALFTPPWEAREQIRKAISETADHRLVGTGHLMLSILDRPGAAKPQRDALKLLLPNTPEDIDAAWRLAPS